MRPTGIVLALALAAAGSLAPRRAGGAAPGAAAQDQAGSGWKAEFEELCAKTQDAMALPSDALKALVERCDRLQPAIDALDESERKVYARRLKACRDLYAYVLESRQQAQDR